MGGGKILAHYHNKGVSAKQENWLYDKLYRRFFAGLKVILLSERLFPDVEKYVSRENVFICPNGIPEPGHLRQHDESEQNETPRLLFLSNLMVDKGVLVLLDALRILREIGRQFVCDFVGGETKGFDAARFNREVEARGLDAVVSYHGKQYGEAKEAYWQNAAVFVFPSFNECFPLVLLEAMQHKVPVISTDEGGIPDIVEDGVTGRICLKGDAADLASKLDILISRPDLRRQYAEAGYEKYRSTFTVDIWEGRMAEILSLIID